MAVVNHTVEDLKTHGEKTWVYTWANMLNGDVGQAIEMPSAADRSIQVSGTFGTGGTLQLQGSNNGTTYPQLNDLQGDPLQFTAAGLEQIIPIARLMRPVVSAGDGTTSLTVSILIRRS